MTAQTPSPELPPPWTFDTGLDRATYVARVLDQYRSTPTVEGYLRRADRRLAAQLYERRVSLSLLGAAFSLAAVRRICADPWRPPIPIRSLHYFNGVVDELVADPPDPRYVQYLRWKLKHPPRVLVRDDGAAEIELWSGIPWSRFLLRSGS